jgi:hypothetical protein
VPDGMCEIALVLAVKHATVGVALLCPAHFMMSGPAYRQRLLQGYMDEGRLAVVSSPGQQWLWVCAFSTAGHMHSDVQPAPSKRVLLLAAGWGGVGWGLRGLRGEDPGWHSLAGMLAGPRGGSGVFVREQLGFGFWNNCDFCV